MRWHEIKQAHIDRLMKAHSRLSGEMRTIRQSMADRASRVAAERYNELVDEFLALADVMTPQQAEALSVELKAFPANLDEDDGLGAVNRQLDRLDRQKAQAQIQKKREEIQNKQRQIRDLRNNP